MRFSPYGGWLISFHLHRSAALLLRGLHAALGPERLIALLRAVAACFTGLSLAAIARVMWAMSPAADALLAGAVAIAWTAWLEHRGLDL